MTILPIIQPFNFGARVWPGLSKLIEEAGEVIQIGGKLIATGGEREHWAEADLYARMEEELGDLSAAVAFVIDHSPMRTREIIKRQYAKMDLFLSWHESEGKRR